ALLRTLVGPRNDLPFSVWAEQTMRRILDRMKRLREAIAAQPARPEPGQGNRYTEGEPERLEWHPAGYDWHPAMVVEPWSETYPHEVVGDLVDHLARVLDHQPVGDGERGLRLLAVIWVGVPLFDLIGDAQEVGGLFVGEVAVVVAEPGVEFITLHVGLSSDA